MKLLCVDDLTMKILTPHAYQMTMAEHMIDHDRCALFAGMGVGKTSTSLMVIDLMETMDPGRTLVLAPKRVAQSTWPNEAKKWANFRDIEVSAIVGTPAERKAALRRDANVYTTNYENLPWLIEELGKKPWPFKRVVADEATRLKNFRLKGGGRRALHLSRVAHKEAKYWTNLTGTPAPNGLLDLWGHMWFVDAGQRLGRTFGGFKDRYFESIREGRFNVKTVPRENSDKLIHAAIADVVLSVESKDHFNLPELIVNKIMVDLPSGARKQYREMEKKLYTEIKGNGIEAFNAGAKTGKCHQLANGAVYLTEEVGDDVSHPAKAKEWVEVHDGKLQALESVVAESAGAPILVAYHFKSDLVRLLRAFPDGRELDDDPRTEAAWNRGEIPILFAHPASAGHGLNLQDGGNIIVYFSLDWNLEQHDQILERIGPTRQAQSGYDRPVFVHYIMASDTIDEDILERLETKGDIQSILMAAMKRRVGT